MNVQPSQANATPGRLRSIRVAGAPEPTHRSAGEQRRSLVQATVFQSVERLLAKLPSAAMLVDWDMNTVCWNAAALRFSIDRACTRAVDGKYRANGSSSNLPLPREILAACRSMQNRRPVGDDVRQPLVTVVPVDGRHPETTDWRASIAMVFFEVAPHGRPMFLIEIEASARKESPTSEAIDAFARLSACEREVALLVADGCSNGEIARNLGKSVMTVKKQLRSIYQKLKVPNRGRLGALIH